MATGTKIVDSRSILASKKILGKVDEILQQSFGDLTRLTSGLVSSIWDSEEGTEPILRIMRNPKTTALYLKSESRTALAFMWELSLNGSFEEYKKGIAAAINDVYTQEPDTKKHDMIVETISQESIHMSRLLKEMIVGSVQEIRKEDEFKKFRGEISFLSDELNFITRNMYDYLGAVIKKKYYPEDSSKGPELRE
jgi:hypothetical protein